MFKKLLALSLLLPLSLSQALAKWDSFDVREEGGEKTARAVWKGESGKFALESAGPGNFEEYRMTLSALKEMDGYPKAEEAEGKFTAQNSKRQEAGNLFHLFRVSHSDEGGALMGFVQFGRMPTKKYPEGVEGNPTAHHPILKTWMEFGVTEQVDADAGYSDVNIQRIGNRGLSFILPLFLEAVTLEERTEVIEACYEFVCRVTSEKHLLPVEGTLSYAAISLLHPGDANVKAFVRAGFEADENPGFGWFYPKEGVPQPRTMVSRHVDGEKE